MNGTDPYVAYLARMQSHHVTVAMRELGRQLTIAAGLCEAFECGYVDGYHSAERHITKQPIDWRPGCQRCAP